MRTAFIIIAIFAAVVLLVRFAAPHAKPRFLPSERITNSALLDKMRVLGKKCAVTEHGLGLSGTLKIRRVIDQCKKNVTIGRAADWQYELCNASDTILHAYLDGKKDVRQSAYCGHVGKYPRIYLFCETLVSNLDCEITEDVLFNAISAFEENSPFSISERKIICGMLKFCLLGHLFIIAENALKRRKDYDKGVADGKDGRVDLDFIHSVDYVCGMIDGFTEDERDSAMRLLEYNEIDTDAAIRCRRKFLAKAYVTVNSVVKSISCIDKCKDNIYTQAKSGGVRSRRYAKVFNFLFPTLIAVYAVFTCIFASPKYVALFSVASIITYVVMRIPVLLYSPPRGIDIFMPIEKLLYRMFNRKNSIQKTNKLFMSETAYFGSEPEYIESKIDGGLNVCCDNRGGISIMHGSTVDALYVGIEADGTTTNLSECDGAVELHRATYRVCKVDIESCAEVIAPIDCNACMVRLTAINRCASDKVFKIIGAVVRKKPVGQNCITQNIIGGAMAVCDNGFALSVGEDGNYCGDITAYCDGSMLKHGRTDKPALVGVTTLNVKRFTRVVKYITVLYTSSRTEAESLFRHVSEPLFFSRAVIGSAVYSKLNTSNKLPTTTSSIVERAHNKCAAFPPPRLPQRDLSYVLPFGGITDSGDVVIDNGLFKAIDNTIANGQFSLNLNNYGIQNISVDGVGITVPADNYLHNPRAFVVIGESGVIWSPTVKPISSGEMRTVHSRGYTEYTCAYNGAVCNQKCFVVGSSAFVDITLHNKTDVERKFDVMFSAVCDGGTTVALSDLGVTACDGTNKLLFYAIDNSPEYALYKEGYFVYGKIDRACGFRSGGSTPAPTVSVCKTIKANGSARVVFCISDGNSAQRFSSMKSVDELFDGVKAFYSRFGRVLPKTDDCILNLSYLQSLYSAYSAFAAKKSMPLFNESLILSTAKYVNPIGVKNRIFEILTSQKHTGELGDYSGCLQFIYCVIEYSEFMQSGEFWNEVLPYAPYNSRGKRVTVSDTVYNHILRAVKSVIISTEPHQYGIVPSLWQCKNLICVLRFFERKINPQGDLYKAYKKCFAYAAETYSRLAKRLTDNNFFEFKSVAEAYMCAKLLFDLDLNEKAYNIIKFNNPIERLLHYGERSDTVNFDYFSNPTAAAVYYTAVTERLFGVKFRGKSVKISPHTAKNTPSLAFDIIGKTKDVHISVDDTEHVGNWKMRVNRINYPADRVDIGELGDDIVFYRDGNE